MVITFAELRIRPASIRRLEAAVQPQTDQMHGSLAHFGLVAWDAEDVTTVLRLKEFIDTLSTLQLVSAWVGAQSVRDAIAPVFVGELGSHADALDHLDASLEKCRRRYQPILTATTQVDVGVAYYDFAHAAKLRVEDRRWGPDGDATLVVSDAGDDSREVKRDISQRKLALLILLHQLADCIARQSPGDEEEGRWLWQVFIGILLLKASKQVEALDCGDLGTGMMSVTRLRQVIDQFSM